MKNWFVYWLKKTKKSKHIWFIYPKNKKYIEYICLFISQIWQYIQSIVLGNFCELHTPSLLFKKQRNRVVFNYEE